VANVPGGGAQFTLVLARAPAIDPAPSVSASQ
jgi:two-component system C4-dicarboxylate transport sensor histidine kinase DctB